MNRASFVRLECNEKKRLWYHNRPHNAEMPSLISSDALVYRQLYVVNVLCVVIDTIDCLSRGELRRERQEKRLESIETSKLAALGQFF